MDRSKILFVKLSMTLLTLPSSSDGPRGWRYYGRWRPSRVPLPPIGWRHRVVGLPTVLPRPDTVDDHPLITSICLPPGLRFDLDPVTAWTCVSCPRFGFRSSTRHETRNPVLYPDHGWSPWTGDVGGVVPTFQGHGTLLQDTSRRTPDGV